VAVGQTFTDTMWGSYLRDNINKLLNQGHRVLTVAQFAALTGLEGTKGVVAPDEVYLEVDSVNGVQWHLAYESGEPTYKWRYLGGPPLVSTVLTSEATSSATYVDLATSGPTITVARGGDYDVKVAAYAQSTTANDISVVSYTVGATVSSDVWAARMACNAFGFGGAADREWRQAAVAASAAVKAQYRTNNGPTTFSNRRIAVRPVRII
jgi:hypothetical protein